jgi:hypothetical protein
MLFMPTPDAHTLKGGGGFAAVFTEELEQDNVNPIVKIIGRRNFGDRIIGCQSAQRAVG